MKSMMKILIAMILCAGLAGAQVCTVEEAPEIRGLKLGMKRKEFLRHFPDTKPINMFNRRELSRVRGFSGLELLAFRINNDSLLLEELELRYAGLSGGIDRLTVRVGRELGVPQDAWKIDGDKAEMQCLKFNVKADAKNNGFTITKSEDRRFLDQ